MAESETVDVALPLTTVRKPVWSRLFTEVVGSTPDEVRLVPAVVVVGSLAMLAMWMEGILTRAG